VARSSKGRSPARERVIVPRVLCHEYGLGELEAIARSAGPRVLRFDIADPSFDTPVVIRRALVRALGRPDATHYSRIRGLEPFVRAVAGFYRSHFEAGVDPMHEVMSTVGSGEALFIVFSSIVSPGDEFILPNPTFPNYASLLALFGGRPRFAPTTGEFHLDLGSVERAITARTRGVVICTPNNPTGACYTREELARLLELCEAHDLIVIADESYSQVTYDGRAHVTIASLPGALRRAIVVNGLSKSFAMTGWRLGYIIARADLVEQFEKVGYEIHGCVNTAVQYAGVVALRRARHLTSGLVAKYSAKRAILVDGLVRAGLSCHLPEGGFEAFPQIPSRFVGSMAFVRFLAREAGVLAKPGSYFGPDGDRHVRLVYCREDRQLRAGVGRIARALRRPAGRGGAGS
jgi:aminotransferase